MTYLLLSILCSAAIALIFKYSEARDLNRYAVTAVNYLAASSVSLVLVLANGLPVPPGTTAGQALRDLGDWSLHGALSPAGSLAWAVALGLVAGVFFFLSFIFYQVSVRRHGASLAGAFIKLGVLLPMSLSLVLWREYPSALQWAGVAFALASILLANWPRHGRWREGLHLALILLFLTGGMSEFSNKIFQKYALSEHKALFLLVVFSVALVLSVVTLWRKNRVFGGREWWIGVMVGAPNLFTSYFLILALTQLPAAVAFPVFGAGTVIVISAISALFFGERPGRMAWWSIGLSALALILINF